MIPKASEIKMLQFLIEPFTGRQQVRGNDHAAMQASGIALLYSKPERYFGLSLLDLEIWENVAQKLLCLLVRYLPSMVCSLIRGCPWPVVKVDGASPPLLQPVEDSRLNLGNTEAKGIVE